MTASDLTALLSSDLTRDENRLVLADALEDAGRADDARLLRGCNPHAIIRLGHEPKTAAAVAAIRAEFGGEVYDRRDGSLALAKGYDARKARELLAQFPGALLVVVSDSAPTGRGLRKIRPAGGVGAQLLYVYYRKSSRGRWGRPAEVCYVTPKGK
jgi:hypothetical protein